MRGFFMAKQMDDLFKTLEDEGQFVDFVSEKYTLAPGEISHVMHCTITIESARVKLAHGQYMQNLDKLKVLLKSSNPDHYKRSGSLLHCLYQTDIIVEIDPESSAEELEAGFTRVSKFDADNIAEFVRFYESYHNQFHAFDLAYRCCAAYEHDNKRYDFDYLQNMCRYLNGQSNLSLETFFMLFKSLMH